MAHLSLIQMQEMKIEIISGSARVKRQSHKVAMALLDKLEQVEGVEVGILDVREYDFPQLQYRLRYHPEPPEKMVEFGRRLEEADAYILVSPEYNNSYSGAIKNTMDHFYPEYEGNAFGIVAVSTGSRGGVNAMKNLQHLILTLKGIPYYKALLTAKVKSLFDGDELVDEDYSERMDGFLKEFLVFARKF